MDAGALMVSAASECGVGYLFGTDFCESPGELLGSTGSVYGRHWFAS